MKKILLTLILSVILGFSATVVFAQDTVDPPTACCIDRDLTNFDPECVLWQDSDGDGVFDTGCFPINDPRVTCCIMNTIFKITDWIFIVLLGLALIFVLLGAYNIITAGGSPDKVITGRNYILFAIVGLVIGFFARAVPNFAVFFIRGI